MATNPTIVVGSLNDQEIKESINKLVEHVDKQSMKMAENFDAAIKRMKDSLKSLGKDKIDISGVSDGGSAKRTKAIRSEIQANKELTMTLEQQAAAQQRAISPKSAGESYSSILKNMRENVALLKMEINSMPSMSLDKQFAAYMQYERQIEQVRNRIAELRQQLNEMANDPNASRLVKKQALDEISMQQQRILQLEREQLQITRQIDATDKQALASKQAQYEKEKQELIALSVGERERITFAQQEANARGKVTDEMRKQAMEVNSYAKESIQREEERRNAILQTGIAAQETFSNIRQNVQVQLADNTDNPIMGIKELAEAIRNMERAYWDIDVEKRESPIGQALKRDIENAKKLRIAIEAYNKTLVGIPLVQEETVRDKKLGSYNELSNILKTLTDEYRTLGREERNSAEGEELANKIQRLSRETQKIQQQMNRPISLKSILGFEPKTIDDIAYKIRQLNSYKQGIDITKPGAASEIRKVDIELIRLNKDLNKYMDASRQVNEINNALGRSWNYMKNRLAFYFTVGASTAFVKRLVEVRSEYEMNERALGILVNSAERGTQIFKELSEMSLVSPYTLIELSSAAKQLTAYDIAAKDVVDTTRRLADMASAVGIPIERLTYAIGQIKAYGYLNSRDARMFANAGIPLVKQLADYYTELEGKLVSTADIYDRIKKKAIGYNDVMSVMYKMTDEGGKFFDFQAKMAETLKVQLANLTLAWNNMLNDIGEETQGMLSFGIGALRKLFLHWRDLDSAIYNVAWTLGLLKTSQLSILAFSGKLRTLEGWYALLGKTITNVGYSAGKAFAVLAQNPALWVAAATLALVSLIRHINKVRDAAREMNAELARGAKEASDSLYKFLGREDLKVIRSQAGGGLLNDADASKDWEEIREQIELSSDNANVFISDLMKIEDLNTRVSAAFDLADKIQIATNKLSGLNEDAFKVSQDSWLWGAFGEGLAEDLEDYVNEALGKTLHRKLMGVFDASSLEEGEREMAKLADDLTVVLNDRLGADVADPKILGEAIERFRKAIKDKNPQIKGEVAQWFDVRLDQLLAERFNQATIASTSINRQFLTILKRDYSSAFSNVTDDILNENAKWGKAQIDAIKKAAEELKKTTVPEWHSAIDEMVRYMNSQDWRTRIVTEMGTGRTSDLQSEFTSRLGLTRSEMFEFKAYKPSGEEDLPEYIKRLQDSRKKLREENEKYEKDESDYSQKRLQSNNKYISSIETILDLFHQAYEENKKSGTGSKKDPLGDALAKEVQLIGEMQKRYKEYRQMGVNANTALTLATDEYGNSLARTNAVLNKFGIQTKTNNELAGMNLRQLRVYYQSLLAGASKSGNAKGIEAIEKALANLNVEITKLDYKKITEGLNSELDKLKDEYELAVELDANPEMGDMFLNLFDIDPNALPKTIDQYAERVLNALNKSFEKRKIDFRLPSFILTNDDIKAFKAQLDAGVLDQLTYDQIVKYYKDIKGMREKEAKDILKQTQDIEYKLADVNGKIAIEQKKLADLENDLAKETNAEKKHLLELQIEDQKNAIDKLKESVLEMLPTYQRLFGEVAEHSAWMSRKLAQDYKDMLVNAQKAGKNENGKYVITDPISGEKVEVTENKLGKEIKNADKELRKTQSIIGKLREAFTKGKDKEIDWVHGIELVGEEAKKAAEGLQVISQMMQQLGGSEDAIEVVNDLSASLEGVSTAAQGIGQIASGDFIGGAVNVIKGLWQTISTWFDNSDKKITRNVKRSEDAVKRLELAYKQLEYEVEQAYGTTELGAQKAVIANKKLQLAELQRQLQLEKSRKAKKQDADKIRDLEGQIIDLQHEINDGINDMTNNLLGISGVGDAVENMIGSIIDSLRNGEDALDVWNTSIDDMIANMIMKFASTKILAPMFEKAMQEITDEVSSRGAESYKMSQDYRQNANKLREEREKASPFFWKSYDEQIKEAERLADEYEARAKEESAFRLDDLRRYADLLNGLRGEGGSVVSEVEELLKLLGLPLGETNKNLSNLQQGIQGITEDQAGALEAYWNANTQQQYVQSELLTQIRDAVVVMNADVQLATQAQILLQLQNSYQVQMSIQGILVGVLNPSGRAFSVELVS